MKRKERILSLLLALLLCVGLFPGAALAEEPGEIAPTEEGGSIAPAEEPAEAEQTRPAEGEEPAARIPGENETEGTVIQTGMCGRDTSWTLDDEGLLSVSGTGAIELFGSERIYKLVKTVVIHEGIPAILQNAFSGFSEMESVSIPSTVTSIGKHAFSKCTKLSEVHLSEGLVELSGFDSCSALTEIRIPSTVRIIGESAFYGCGLSEVTIPNGVTDIQFQAFYGCYMKEVTIPPSVTHVGKNALTSGLTVTKVYLSDLRAWLSLDTENIFSLPSGPHYLNGELIREVDIPEGITCIPNGAFCGCQSLERVTFPESVTEIRDHAFYDCGPIQEIELPDGMTAIGDYAFTNCTALSRIKLPSGLDSIGNYAFQNCTALSELELPESLTWIGGYGFAGCSSLENITIPPGVSVLTGSLFQDCSGIRELEIPETVTEIQAYAFAGTGLEYLFLPASVEKTRGSAYYLCPNLAEIEVDENNPNYSSLDGILYEKGMTKLLCCPQQKEGDILIPESITMVDGYAFYECSNITSVSFPWKESDWHLAGLAFYQCENLREITFRGRSPYLTSGSDTSYGSPFYGITATIYYPENNYTWTERGKQAFEGYGNATITWVGYEETPVVYDAGACGEDLTWELWSDACLKIRGTGEMYDYESGGPWWDNKYYIKNIVLEEGVTGIGDHAFYFCNNLANVELPEGLKRIGQEAFSTCGISLRSIRLPASLELVEKEAFLDCKELAEVYYGGTLEQWEKLDIRLDNTELKSAHIICTDGELDHSRSCGDHLTWSLDEENCVLTISGTGDMWNYKSVCAPWRDKANKILSCVVEPGVESIGAYAFYGNGSLKDVTLPESLRQIGEHAFESCRGMQEIRIPEGVIRIGDSAFIYCFALTGVSLPDTLLEIGDYAFFHCAALADVRLSNSLLKIGDYAFDDCSALTEVQLPDTLAELGHCAFYCCGLKTIRLPESLKWIGKNALNCSFLKEVWFEGSAPANEGLSPDGTWSTLPYMATAYYPAGDESWTEEVRKSFGNGVTWVSYVPIVWGDANGDGAANILDIVRLRKVLAGVQVEVDFTTADFDGDGVISSLDLMRLRKLLVGTAK